MKLIKINSHTLVIQLTSQWQQEHSELMAQNILQRLGDYQRLDSVTGADRYDYRFRFQQQDFVLHFEFYSESCWIDAEDVFNDLGIQPLLSALAKG